MKDLINNIKERAIQEHIPIIMDETLYVIKEMILELKPTKILEIGTAVGYSAICFSEFLENKSKIDTIEIDETRVIEARENILAMNLQDRINVILGNAVEILPTLEKEYDMIFIDASKSKYPFFLSEAMRLSHKGSVIIADNVLYKGYVLGNYNKHKQRTAVTNLRNFLKEVTDHEKLDTKILEVGDGLAISKVK